MREWDLSVQIDQKCSKCGMKVKQSVTYKEEDGRLKIEVWQHKCHFCNGFLQKPTLGEVRRAIILNGMQKK